MYVNWCTKREKTAEYKFADHSRQTFTTPYLSNEILLWCKKLIVLLLLSTNNQTIIDLRSVKAHSISNFIQLYGFFLNQSKNKQTKPDKLHQSALTHQQQQTNKQTNTSKIRRYRGFTLLWAVTPLYSSSNSTWTFVSHSPSDNIVIPRPTGLIQHIILTESTIGFILECCILNFGVLLYIYNCNEYLWSAYGFGQEYEVTRGISYLLMISLFSSIIRLPFELYRVFLVDCQSDVSDKSSSSQSSSSSSTTTTSNHWFKQIVIDQIKMFLVSLLIGLPLLAVTIALFSWKFPFQWLYIIIFVSTVALFFSDMYPSLAFLFNNFSLMEDGELREEISKLSNKLGFPLKEIYTMDGSKRVSHSNAFLLGFWSSSIVLYDNLIKQQSTPEILSIIGHEIGHHKFKLLVLKELITFANLLRFVTNLIRREFEYAADRYAIENGLDMKKALLSMYGNGTYIKPDIYFSLYYYSHPSLMERLDSIDSITNELNKKSE
ncbi:hypothetical protein PPL_05777 [Heterostelium album PN500]|uniref:Ste24 endopeptidase n=1 Tax=Heterostelium pallidum (strain ATCC 26659 / Pp 5 / PN500) TaxID=670386 RepID=D3BB45_HETP5|nr:hypothetical protein PPL_05777 [Heterostelium album PN500]EFA81782.1 hypothetical protein PPL_05777 [Heterostelium album PN500]|eukprot:XP_020433899.1 hypothetical protein PPL_05777 [Heterostelium album PN500]